MAKIRGIKPEFWTDEDIVDLSIAARLLFIGLWTYACDNGHLQDKPKQIKMRTLPADDVSAAELLRELEAKGRIRRVDGWIVLPNFTKHQKPDKRYFQTCDKARCIKPKHDSPAGTRGGDDEPTTSPAVGSMGPHVDGDGDGDGDGEVRVSAARKRPATHLPDTWQPTDKHLEKSNEGIDVAREADKFRLHAEANDRRQVSWNAAFSQWLLNARPAQAVSPLRPAGQGADDWMRR